MKNGTLKKVLNRSYDFGACRDDLDLVNSIHDGRYRGDKPGDPSFHAYAATVNIAGEFASQALDTPKLITFNNKLADLQEEYMPSYPPMSPVTTSFFQAWMVLDARIPPDGPTLGGLFVQHLRSKNILPFLWKALDTLNKSYGSFHEVVGIDGDHVRLLDIPRQTESRCWNSSGYTGKTGEVWYVRVLPPYADGPGCSVTLNTPYVFRNENRKSWQGFFRRRLSEDDSFDLQQYLKNGKTLQYWLEYVFQAYLDHTGNAIFLAGLPDNATSRPHSEGGKEL